MEVKEAYLLLREAEKNILVAKKAVVQAEENFRMNEERYKSWRTSFIISLVLLLMPTILFIITDDIARILSVVSFICIFCSLKVAYTEMMRAKKYEG